ncbi:hypothetical protein CP880_01675 [Cutibacterium namnetense]|uniref:Uncharacterized protein n=1 Tax=Cutibacterium namnetense TaxID=1574624 RepID=A0ABX9IAU4_9ACTN|nr:hypothetical protein CP880_01675 [Cutibacterium namnetense]TKW73075.1 MAG: hypothetical protein DI580_01235 [Cutibacterium acnes]
MPQEATNYSTSSTISPHLNHDLRTTGVRLRWSFAVLGLCHCHGIVSAGPSRVLHKPGRRRQ